MKDKNSLRQFNDSNLHGNHGNESNHDIIKYNQIKKYGMRIIIFSKTSVSLKIVVFIFFKHTLAVVLLSFKTWLKVTGTFSLYCDRVALQAL